MFELNIPKNQSYPGIADLLAVKALVWTTKPTGSITPESRKSTQQKVRIDQQKRSELTKDTSRQRSGKGAIRKRFPLQKPRWEKTKLTIRYLYHETHRKPNEQLFSQ